MVFDLHKQCREQRDALTDEVKYLRSQVRALQERCDRLVEAVARREGTQLQLPIEPYPLREPEPAPVEGPASGPGAGPVNTWWRSMCAGGRISTPVPEEKVAPNS